MKDIKSKYAYVKPRINIGKIEVIKTLDILDCGKKISVNQKGKTPRFNHR